MIAPHSIQSVIDRADIVEVIEQFIKLKKRGTNFIGNCPFHNEKTPSFNVNPAKGIFKCFGCGKAGDVVTFVEEYEKFSFYETIRWLAAFYNVELEETAPTEELKAAQKVEESLRIINDFAAQYFQDILHKDVDGKIIGGAYFKERGFTAATIEKFKLGFSLETWDAFSKIAQGAGFDANLLVKSGLVKQRENGQLYDAYRGRVIFPIFSAVGKIVGFGARILKKEEKAPKYVNSPENELYVKNKVLYGLFQSRQHIHKENECFLVEGYTDVISLHQAGVTNVVASSGTSLTDGQLKLIGNLTKNLTIIYDGDNAGIKAALRGLDMALAASFNVKLVLLPDGEDPDSYVQALGADRFKEYLAANKQDVIGFRLEIGLKEVGNDPIKKSQLVNELAETIAKINKVEDFALQEHYIKITAAKLQIEEEGLINLVNKYIRDANKQNIRQMERQQDAETQPVMVQEPAFAYDENGQIVPIEPQQVVYQEEHHRIEWYLMKILIEYGHKPVAQEGVVADVIFNTIDVSVLENEMVRQLFADTLQYFDTHKQMPPLSFFVNNSNPQVKLQMANILNDPYAPSSGWKEIVKIEVQFGDDLYEQDLNSVLLYFELKLVRKALLENLQMMQQEQDVEKIMRHMKVHQQLKLKEKELQRFVIIKS